MKFVGLEGGVCSGKTTVANAVGKETGAYVVQEYMAHIPEAHLARRIILPPEERLKLFLDIEITRHKSIPAGASIVVADRCILTIIAFEYAVYSMGMTTSMVDFAATQDIQVCIPHIVWFLKIPESMRIQRWMKRGYNPDSVFVKRTFNKALEESFYRLSRLVNISTIDATALTVKDVRMNIVKHLFEVQTHAPFNSISLRSLVDVVFS